VPDLYGATLGHELVKELPWHELLQSDSLQLVVRFFSLIRVSPPVAAAYGAGSVV
jgi:hypothetical protein